METQDDPTSWVVHVNAMFLNVLQLVSRGQAAARGHYIDALQLGV